MMTLLQCFIFSAVHSSVTLYKLDAWHTKHDRMQNKQMLYHIQWTSKYLVNNNSLWPWEAEAKR